ncbi:MAG TPA: TonB-dependent receptor [Flavisolibacter sp.]|nr:TonB-dependent receptor [Flavisolibacter sp.]
MGRIFAKGFTVLFLLNSLTLSAQTDEQDLDPITITSSLTPEKASKTGRNLFIIEGEKLYDLPVHSIDELLRYLPGVEVQARGPMGAQSDIVLRGGTFQQVLVILDGVRLNDPNTGHFSSYIPIALSEIERIEILKGAASAIYGSEAVGGVIHIISKTFAAIQNISKSNVKAQVTAGEYGLLNVHAGGFYSNGKTSVALGLASNNADGQKQRGTKGFFNNHTASFSFNQFINERWQLALRSSFDDRKFAAQNFYTTFVSDTADEKVQTLWNQLQLTYKSRKDIIRLSAGYKILDDRYAFNKTSLPNQNKTKLFQALITDEWKPGSQTTIVSGVQLINKKINSNDRGDHAYNQAALFAMLNQSVGDFFVVAPAVRLEWNERAGWELVPQINLSYRIKSIQLRASAGKTIRDADFTERFNNYNKALVSSGRIGNPDLEAERSFSYEAGGDLFLSKYFKLSGTFFQRHHSKMIDYITTAYSNMPRKENLSPTGTYALAKNIATVNTTGFETDLSFSKPLQHQQHFLTMIGFVWLNSISSDTAPSFYISSHAKYMVNMTTQYRNRLFSISINGIYKERQPQTATSEVISKVSKDYFIINIKAEGFLLKEKLTAFVQTDNLFNENYTDVLGSQMPGRWLMGGIKISLSK